MSLFWGRTVTGIALCLGVPANLKPVGMAQTQTNAEEVGCWADSLGSREFGEQGCSLGSALGNPTVEEQAKRQVGCHPNGPQGAPWGARAGK